MPLMHGEATSPRSTCLPLALNSTSVVTHMVSSYICLPVLYVYDCIVLQVAWYRLESVCIGHDKTVNAIAFSPRGTCVATGGEIACLIRCSLLWSSYQFRWWPPAQGMGLSQRASIPRYPCISARTCHSDHMVPIWPFTRSFHGSIWLCRWHNSPIPVWAIIAWGRQSDKDKGLQWPLWDCPFHGVWSARKSDCSDVRAIIVYVDSEYWLWVFPFAPYYVTSEVNGHSRSSP